MLFLTAICALWGFGDADVKLQDFSFQPRDIAQAVQPTMRRLTLAPAPPSTIKRKPDADITAWAALTVGPHSATRTITLALQERAGAKPAIWADADGNGDMTDDPPVEVEVVSNPDGGMQMFRGQFVVQVPKLSDSP